MKVMSSSLGLVIRTVPSCLLPLSKRVYKTIHMKMCFYYRFSFMQIKLIFTSLKGFTLSETHFEIEAKGNLEIAFLSLICSTGQLIFLGKCSPLPTPGSLSCPKFNLR